MKPGYKQTEVGVIPEEWEVKSVRDIGQIKTGPFGTLLKANEYSGSEGVPLISVGEVGAGMFKITEHTPRVPENVIRRLPQYVLRCGDIVFGRKGAVERSALVTEKEDGWFLGSDGISVRPQRFCFPPYLACQFQRYEVQSWLLQNATGTTMASLNQRILSRVQIPYAPLPEQRAIATALSDVDGLLGGLERLIAKKRDLKQAAMQQLLTAQTRLPGFHGEWQVKKLSDLIEEIGDGGTPSTGNPNNFGGQINWAVIDDIKPDITTTATTLTEAGLKACAAKLWNPGTLIVSTGATIGEVGIARIPVATKQGICGIVVDQDEADTIFIKYWFVQNKPLVLSKAQGSTIKEVRAPTLIQLEIRVPPLPEQTAIAEVLSEMDGELAVLEERREKTRALKQSMMQALLTGRIRLV